MGRKEFKRTKSRAGKFRAVFFDAGETLIKVHPSVGEIYCETAKQFGADGDPSVVERLFRRAFGEKKADPNGKFTRETERNWWRDLVKTVYEEAGILPGLGDRFDDCFESLYELFHGPTVWRVYEDVVPTFDGLRSRNIPIAVVSNWDTRLPGLLESLGLTSHLEFVLTSAEVGTNISLIFFFRCLVRRRFFPMYLFKNSFIGRL